MPAGRTTERGGAATLFETQRLLVRRPRVGDVGALLEIFGDPLNVRDYGLGRPFDRATVEQIVRRHLLPGGQRISSPGLALLKPHLTPVGFGGVAYFDRYSDRDEAAMLVYIFKRAYWGRGLATELAREALAAAFGDPRVPAVFATVKPANAASIRVLEKCGLSRLDRPPCTGRLLYRITRAEWEGRSRSPAG